MARIAVFPGSFDPITIGHESIVRRSVGLFDEVYVALGENAEKQGFFPIDRRIEWLEQVFQDLPTVKVTKYSGLTVEFCKRIGAGFILRGLRSPADFEFERNIAQVNMQLHHSLETVFLLTKPEHAPITSSIVRDIFRHKGDVAQFIPKGLNLL
jgi:pantetheine-phosphate adenylyltransferase